MKLSEYLNQNGMTLNDYLKMQKRKEEGKTSFGDYQRKLYQEIKSADFSDIVNNLNSNKFLDQETLTSYNDRVSQVADKISRLQMSDDESNKSFLDSLKNLQSGISGASEYYSSFKDETDYKAQLKAKEQNDAWMSADLDALGKELDGILNGTEISNLKAERDKLQKSITFYNRGDRSTYKTYTEVESAKKRKAELDKKITDIEYSASEKKQFYNNAKRVQDGAALAGISDSQSEYYDPEFKKYAIKGNAMGDEKQDGWLTPDSARKNQVAYLRNNPDALKMYEDSAKAANGGSWGTSERIFKNQLTYKAAKYMKDDEFEIFNAYMGKGDEETAYKYLESIEGTLNARQGDAISEEQDNLFKQIIFSVNAGLDQWEQGIISLGNTDGEYKAPSGMQYASGIVRERMTDDYGIVGQGTYDLFNTTGNMLPSILVSTMTGNIAGGFGAGAKAAQTIGKLAGAATLGGSAAGNGYQEMLNLGYDKSQAQAYGTLVGVSEAGLEYLLGGISSLGGTVSGGITNTVVNKLISNVDNAIAKVAIGSGGKLVGSMISEFGEEYLQEVLDPVFKNITLKTDEDIKLFSVEALYSGILGALSAGLLEGGSTISGEVATYKAGKDVKNSGQLSNLKKFGTSFSADTVAYKIASQVNENTDAYTIGQLLHEVGADSLSETNIAEITKSLERKNIAPEQAQTIAKWLNNAVMGQTFTPLQRLALKNPDISQTFKDVIVNQNSTVNQRMQSYTDILQGIATEKENAKVNKAKANAEKKANSKAQNTEETKATPFIPYSSEEIARRQASGEVVIDSEGKPITDSKDTTESKFEVNIDGKTINLKTGEEVRISEIGSIDNGKMTLKLDNGESVNADDIRFATEDDAFIYSTILDMGVNAAVANSLIKNYNPSDKLSAKKYALGIKEAYKYGSYGMPISEISKKGFAADLSEAQRTHAYNLGKADTSAKVEKAQKEVEKVASNKGGFEGKVHFKGDTLALKEVQKESLKRMGILSEVLGVDFHVFESYMQGKNRVFKDTDGKVKSAPNGYYKDGKIYIDLNAGEDGRGVMIYTVAHELTHWIREWSPAKFKILADFLMEQYGKKGRNVNDFVQAQIKKAKNNGRTIDYDTAYEEVVADSMETMLSDDAVYEKILELKSKDASIVKKIGEFFAKIVDSFKKLMQQYPPETPEGKLVAKMNDSFVELQSLFAEALVDASDNYQANKGQKNTTSEGDVHFMARDEGDTSVKEQIKANQDLLNSMDIVASVQEFKIFKNKQNALEWVLKRLQNTGFKIDRKGFGEIIIDKKRLKNGLSYLKTNEEMLAFAVLPQVLSKGVEIGSHIQHKGRAYNTVTFAAPVVINGQRGNMAAVVRQEGKNYYKVHRLLMPDGSQLILNNKRDIAETAGGVNDNSGLSPTDNISKGSIPQTSKKSQEKQSGRDNLGNTLTEAQQSYFAESKVRDENGNLKVMYHGTPNATFTKFRSGTYFTEHKWYADNYQNQGASSLSYKKTADNPDTYAVYLDIKKPFDTRNKKERDIWYKEFYLARRTSTDLRESGLVDWIDGEDLQEFLEEKGYDYDGLILDEGATGGYGEEVKSRGLSYVIFNPEQVKSVDNKNPTKDADYRFSDRDNAYMDAVNNGDMQTAQRLVDEVAKEAGYKSPMLYHGTPTGFGFTVFDASKVDDKLSFFATNDERIAKTYSGETNRKNISDRITIDVDNASPTELLELLQKHIDENYQLVSKDELEKIKAPLYETIRNSSNIAREFILENSGAFNDEKRRIAYRIVNSISAMADAETESELDGARASYQDATWELRAIDQSIAYELLDAIDTTKLFRAVDDIDLYSNSEALFTNGTKTINDNSAWTILSSTLYTGVYSLYGNTDGMLEVDANGANWNRINTNSIQGAKHYVTVEDGYDGTDVPKMMSFNDAQTMAYNMAKAKYGEDAKIHTQDIRDDMGYPSSAAFRVVVDGMIGEKILVLKQSLQMYTNTRGLARYGKDAGYKGVKISNLKDSGGAIQYNVPSDIYIFFNSSQMKSADPVTYDDNGDVIPLSERFNAENEDIRYSDRDSEGNQLSKTQQEFFKESKVRDAKGNLLKVYHGTPNEFTVFKPRMAQGWGTGIYFTNNKSETTEYGENVVEAYLNITNPFNADTMSYDDIGAENTKAYRDYDMQVWKQRFDEYDTYNEYREDGMGVDMYEIYTEEVEVFNKILRELGYDGIIANHSNNIDGLEIVAFYENQPKLTTNTNPTPDPDIRYSERVTDEETLDYLNEQIKKGEYIKVYRSFQVIDGGLYAPMNAVDRDENGKNKRLGYRSEYGVWEKSTESPEIAQRYMDSHPEAPYAKFDLDGVDNKTNAVAYNPYLHASNLVLNDQFAAAYRRNLITVECYVPLSEANGTYKAQYAKDATGWVDWKAGGVAGKLLKVKPEYTRKLFVSRYMLPVRQVPDAEVAAMYKEYLDGTDIAVPWNVVTPSLRKELENIGVAISYDDVKAGNKTISFNDVFSDDVKLSDRDSKTADDIEKINKQLAKENVKLIEDVKNLKELVKLQGKETHGKVLKKSTVELVAKRLMSYSNSKGDVSELASHLTDVYSYIIQGEDVSWEGIKEKSQAAVDWLMQHESYIPVRDEYANNILKVLRTMRVSLDDAQKAEAAHIYGSFNNYRRKNMGRIIITNDGMSLDSAWQELAEMYPMYFDADVNSADQPIILMDIIDNLQNTYAEDEYHYYSDEMVAQDLMTKVYEGYWDVSALHTVADAKQREINLLKAKHKERMDDLRKTHSDNEEKLRQEHKDRVSELRTQYREREERKLKQVAEYYQKSRKEAVDRVKENREKREAITKLQKLVLETAKWVSYPTKTDIKCPDIIRGPYAEFLSSIDLSSKRLLNGGEPTQNDLRVSSAMDSLAKAIEKKLGTQSPETETEVVLDTGYLDLPVHFVDNLKELAEDLKVRMATDGHIVNSMTSEEVKALTKFIRTLNHSIKEMSTLYSNMRFARVEQLGMDTMVFLKDLGETKQSNAIANFVTWDNALPYYTFKRFGVSGESVFEELMDAQDKLAYLADEIFKFKEKTWTDKEASEWSKDTHTIKLPSGRELTLTSADAMSIYCLSRREQGKQHLLGGGVRVLGIEKNGKKTNDSRSLLNQQDILAIASSLTERQRIVAEAIQQYMSTVCSEWGNEISMKRFLTKEFTEKFYFPIESNDENLDTKDPKAQQSDLYRLLNISATKPLTKGANNEVIIRNVFDVFSSHSSDMAKLNAYGMALLDYMKWINYRVKTTNDDGQISVSGVRKSMETAYGPEAKKYVIGLIKDINGRANDGGDNQILMKMTRAAKTTMVGANLRVSLLQFTAYPRAAMVLSSKSLGLGLTKVPQIKKAMKYCGIALWKSFGFYDTNISRSIEDQIKGTTNLKQKLIELSLKGAEWGDAITWGCLWNACEYEVAKTKKYKVGSEEFNIAVGQKLREVVYATQVVDSTLTRSQMMRSKSGLTQSASAFMSEPTVSANILMDAGFQFNLEKRRTGSAKLAWQKVGKHIGKAIAVYSIGQIFAALAEGIMDAYRDDDDEEFLEKFKKAFIENAISDLNPFNKIPIIADVSDLIMSWFGIGFSSSNSLYLQAVDEANNAFDIWSKVIKGEDGKTVYAGIYSTTKLLSYITGVSASGAMREVVTLWNNTAGAADPYLKIRTYESSATDKGIAEYKFDKGDTTSVKTTVSKMVEDKVKSGKTEKEAKSAVRASFTSTYKEEYLNAVKSKDYDEMNRIRKFLYATGLYGTLTELDETLKKWRTSE